MRRRSLDSSRRTKPVLDTYDDAYAIFPHGRIAGASESCRYTDRALLYDGGGLDAFGEVVTDETRVEADHVLSFMCQVRSSDTTPSALRVAAFALPARPVCSGPR